MNTDAIGMLVRADACLGCQACQVACREENGYGFDERWMELVRRAPRKVSGELRKYHLAAPELDKCALCAQRDHEPLCTVVCPTECLHVGKLEVLLQVTNGPGHWNLHVPGGKKEGTR